MRKIDGATVRPPEYGEQPAARAADPTTSAVGPTARTWLKANPRNKHSRPSVRRLRSIAQATLPNEWKHNPATKLARRPKALAPVRFLRLQRQFPPLTHASRQASHLAPARPRVAARAPREFSSLTRREILKVRNLKSFPRSKVRSLTEFCNSNYVSHFAAFFIVARTKISIGRTFDF